MIYHILCYIRILNYEPPEKKNWQYKICIGRTLVYFDLWKSLKTQGTPWDLSKLAIPLLKFMLSFFHIISTLAIPKLDVDFVNCIALGS